MSDGGWTRIDFDGVVQGVGFRPTVYRVAVARGLRGWVLNATDGVHLTVSASGAQADELVEAIRRELPPIARIDSVKISGIRPPVPEPLAFTIADSRPTAGRPTDVSPDAAICAECLADIDSQPRRLGYPLTNCTNCGPRFSIVEALPYDRPLTSMARFAMCDGCRREYTSPADRRFHAQPVSCNRCGPRYRARLAGGIVIEGNEAILSRTASLIADGEIVALKGIGGYNLICSACSAAALARLRELKRRPRKPFAVMFASPEALGCYAVASPDELHLLGSWRAPIVVLPTAGASRQLPPEVAPGCSTLGCMLPYMGFHHLLLRRLGPDTPVIVTSANRPGLPIITDDDDADAYAAESGIAVVGFNRAIVNRQDDSVVRFDGGEGAVLLRRSRGYVPEPITISDNASGIIGFGADITSQWALGRGCDIIQSPYIGRQPEAAAALTESVESMCRLFEAGTPGVVAVDAHPRYESRRLGLEMAQRCGARVEEIWHHHAHAASVMADLNIRHKVLALVLDGTGLAPDGRIHGSELMVADLMDFTTLRHGEFLPMPGGDAAARQPWRMAVSLVESCAGENAPLPPQLPEAVGREAVGIVRRMIRRGINSPASCGAGRLWDAVAALSGIAYVNAYEAEAPLLLESLASSSTTDMLYPVDSDNPLSLTPMTLAMLDDIAAGADPALIARKFHNSYAAMWAMEIERASRLTGLRQVVASGGVMQNMLLVGELRRRLSASGIELLLPRRVTANDACIAAGQIAIAAARRANL